VRALLHPGKLAGRLLLLVMVLLVLPGGAQPAPAAPAVKVGVYGNPPKVVLGGPDGASGIYVEVLRQVAAHDGFRFQYVPGTFQQGLDRLDRGEIDLMVDVTKTPERTRLWDFNREPVLESWNEVFVRRGLRVQRVFDLNGRKVGVLAGSIQQILFEREAASYGVRVQLVPYGTYEEAFAAARRGDVDAVAANPFIGQLYYAGMSETAIVFGSASLHFVARKGQQGEVLAAIDRQLVALKADPSSTYSQAFQALVNSQRHTGFPDWLLQLAASAAALALVAAAWAYTARRAHRRLQQAESQQRQLAEERMALLREAEQRERELHEANEDLQAVSFSLSHDLRQPLAAIGTFLGTALERATPELDARSVHLIRRSRAAAERMDGMVRGLGELLKVAGEPLQYADCDLSAIAWSVARNLQEETGREPEVVVAPGLRACADPRMLRTALENLLGNAWKFSAGAAAPRIEVGLRGQEGDENIFFVRDNGAGFPTEYAENLFRPFTRLHAEGEFPGSGIGLTIVQRMIVRHGGRIWAEGAPGAGATFYFTLRRPGA
jgi:signal transduction histidine kinase